MGLEPVECLERAVPGAFEAADEGVEQAESPRLVGFGGPGEAGTGCFVGTGKHPFDLVLLEIHAEIKNGVLDEAKTGKAPRGLCEVVDELLFGDADGTVLEDVAFKELAEAFRGFVGEDGGGGSGEAVLEGFPFRAALRLGRNRVARMGGVAGLDAGLAERVHEGEVLS